MLLQRIPWWAPVLLGGLVIGVHNALNHPFSLDDAFITFRYAENWVAGHGPVFNPSERVEGYTTFLWMALMAGAAALGLPVLASSKVLGVLCSMASLVLVARADRIVPGLRRETAVAGAILLATSPISSRWSMTGMEVPLVALLATAAVLVHLRGREGQDPPALAALAGLLAALAIMSRPDAGLVIGVLGLDRLLGLLRRRGRVASLFAMTGAFLAVAGTWFAWRYDFYGYPLPNTFYVKVGSTSDQVMRGVHYLLDGLRVMWPVVLLGLGGLVRGLPGGLRLVVALALLHYAYVVAVGGDVFWGYRFFAAYWPLQALAAAGALAHLVVGRFGRLLPLLAVGVGVAVNLTWLVASHDLNYEGVVAKDGEAVGRWLREHAPPEALLATNIAGTIPYYSRLETIDTLGLNDLTIAHRPVDSMGQGRAGHEKGYGAYVLRRKPDYVLFGSSLGDIEPHFLGDEELFAARDFHQAYDLHLYAVQAPHRDAPRWLRLWVRRAEAGGRGLQGVTPKLVLADVRSDPKGAAAQLRAATGGRGAEAETARE